MTSATFYALIAIALFCLALHGLITRPHLLHKIIALNILGSSVFLLLVALAKHTPGMPPDPVSHAMVITGIVVAVSATALALSLMLKLHEVTGMAHLPEDSEGEPGA